MTLPLEAIGKTASQAALGTAHSLRSKGLKFVSFGSQFQQQIGQIGTDANSVLSQIAGMLQAGTPLATIIDRVATIVSNALANATGNDANTNGRGTLERALAGALAPPGTSPPNQSRIEEAAALERRLGNILSGVTRELNGSGQQKRFSGAILDAKPAKEIPAQQQTKQAAGVQMPSGSTTLAESVLQSAVQQLQSAQTQAPVQSAAHLAPKAPAQSIPQITTQSPDVLGRMLARAASAGTQQTDPNAAAPAPAPLPAHSAPTGDPSTSPADLFARLMTVIAQSSKDGASHGGKQSQEFAFAKNAVPAPHQTQSSANGPPGAAFSASVSAANAPAAQSGSPAATPYTDPQSVIEQLVKGIVFRNFGATSEVRMRLQPEHLGDVSLKLTVTGNTISANIVAQNANVRDMLLSNQQQLARTLADAGLSLGAFSVDVSGGNPGFSQQQSTQHRSLSKAGAVHLETAPAEDDTWADSPFGPPAGTGAKSLVLNHLA